MDFIQKPENLPGCSKTKIHLKTYFDEYREKIKKLRPQNGEVDPRKLTREAKKLLISGPSAKDGIDDRTFRQLEAKCSIDNFTVEGECPPMRVCLDLDEKSYAKTEVRNFEFVPIPEPAPGREQLKTLQYLDEATKDGKLRSCSIRYYNNIRFESAPKPPPRLRPNMIDTQIVISVRVYKPWKSTAKENTVSFRYSQEIVLLGTNTLSDLRDFIKCPVDYTIAGDVSDALKELEINPLTGRKQSLWESEIKNKDLYRSGFIFIEGCFYNDMRFADCIDYSEVIREWAAHPKRKLGTFSTAKMEDTPIENLEIRLGFPYVYVHQGDHEHLISFVDAHLLSADDCQYPSRYPYERSIGSHHSKYCFICNKDCVKWVTVDNERVPETPFYFCDKCYREFNYDAEGKKKTNFFAYNFVEANAI